MTVSALPGLFCPACGQQSLALPLLGPSPVTCYNVNCSRRTAATEILADGQIHHVVTFTEVDFTIRHPLIERLDDALLTCDLHKVCQRMDGPPPAGLGRYRAERQATDEVSWMFQKILVPTAGVTS